MVEDKYSVIFYKTVSGRDIVIQDVKSFDVDTRVRIRNVIRLLRQNGLGLLPTPWVKKLNKKPDIFELRVTSGMQIRLLFFQYDSQTFLITNIFHKKTQKTPKHELDQAIKRVKEFI